MIDTSGFSNESTPRRDLPEWPANETLIKSNPELHHYTNRDGLKGICKSNSLWATHFSKLSDCSEIMLLKQPLKAALAALLQPLIMKRQREGSWVRDHVKNQGGVEAAANYLWIQMFWSAAAAKVSMEAERRKNREKGRKRRAKLAAKAEAVSDRA